MQEMLEAGVHFGHKASRGNPKMGKYIYGARDGIHIIDLASSEAKLKEAANFVNQLAKDGKTMLVVGTKKQAREVIAKLAQEANLPYLNQHWVGGLLTNFDEIRKNITKLNGLKKEQQEGTLSRYTKKEQLLIGRKLEKFELEMGGIANMEKLPEAIFILDTVSDSIAVREARRVGMTIVGVSDTNANPDDLDYPIPANDDGIKSIKIIAEAIIEAYKDGAKDSEAAKTVETKVEETKEIKEVKKAADKTEELVAEAIEIQSPVVEEAAVIEEEIEKKILAEAERKID